MAGRVRAFDWANTPLGPIDSWPQSLRVAVGICLNSRFPMFVWWGPEQINIYNDAYVPILGKRHPEALGKPARRTWSEIWSIVGPQGDAVLYRGESTWNERVLLVMERNGYTEDTYFTWSYSPIPDGSGGIGGLFCVCTEETQVVRAEAERNRYLDALANERSKLAAVIEHAPSFICALRGPDHVFELANERYHEIVGKRDLVGKTIREVLPEVEGQGFFELLDNVYRTGEPFIGNEMPVMLRRRRDEPLEQRVMNLVYQPLREVDGAISGIFVHGVDVTDLVRAREAIRESEGRFRAAFDQSVVGIVLSDGAGRIQRVNEAFCRIVGYRPEQIVGRDSAWFTHPDDIGRNTEILAKIADRQAPAAVFEKRYIRGDGLQIIAQIHVSAVHDAEGRLANIIAVCVDVTEYRRAEAERARLFESERSARSEAERASRMKDDFLATLSHELRTPLNAIFGWSQILQSTTTDPELREGLAIIERNARAQTQIIEDLLDMSRIVSGKVRLDVQRVDLIPTIEAAIETIRPAADAKGIRLQAVLDPAAGPILGDPSRLQQVLANLLSNAVKFTHRDGRVQVLLERVNSHVEITVHDTGQGIKPEFLPYVFDRFRQADGSTTRRHGGLGLGLSIVRQLVELHGGTVQAKSSGEGQGATFVVALPTTPIDDPAQDEKDKDRPNRVRARNGGPVCDGPILEGLAVLVVDDEADSRELVKRVLTLRGAEVTLAGSVDEALELFAVRRPDAVLSDIGMPGRDGYALIAAIRTLPRNEGGDVPAAALTAFARSEDRTRALLAGYQAHVAKPVEPAELIATVVSIVGRLPTH